MDVFAGVVEVHDLGGGGEAVNDVADLAKETPSSEVLVEVQPPSVRGPVRGMSPDRWLPLALQPRQ